MITGVFFILAGETAIFRSEELLCWALVFFALNTVWFKVSEEPGLVKRFGADYIEYRANVPMWIPRLKPWRFEKL